MVELPRAKKFDGSGIWRNLKSMSLTILKREALKLPKAQRLKLAGVLLDSVPADRLVDEEPLTMAEIDRRADELKSGKVKGISSEIVHAAARRRAGLIKSAA
jgi:putative addiction module component (TIGR02574 family)